MDKVVKKQIVVVEGHGEGLTELAAFDNALLACGLGNYNLIRLSSIIPPDSKIHRATQLDKSFGNWGDKLYIVYASASTQQSGEQAWAGIAWVLFNDDGTGLFVEHEAHSEKECRQLLQTTLTDMCLSRGYMLEDCTHEYVVVGAQCESKPVAVVAAAAFRAEGWGYVG